MSDDFIDSNVIFYLFDEINIDKRRTARRLIDAALGSGDCSISFQVVQEVLNVMIHRYSPAGHTPETRAEHLRPFLCPYGR
jgi:predicted nucleic acid-binding protein